MQTLDKLDRQILRSLQSDGRATYDQIAEGVGLSPSAVLRRVKRLEDSGVIDLYVALVKPEAILISAGFDAHRDDPLADVQLSTDCYAWMTARVLEVAAQYAGGRVISLLEGGYHLSRTAECIERHVAVLAGKLNA